MVFPVLVNMFLCKGVRNSQLRKILGSCATVIWDLLIFAVSIIYFAKVNIIWLFILKI